MEALCCATSSNPTGWRVSYWPLTFGFLSRGDGPKLSRRAPGGGSLGGQERRGAAGRPGLATFLPEEGRRTASTLERRDRQLARVLVARNFSGTREEPSLVGSAPRRLRALAASVSKCSQFVSAALAAIVLAVPLSDRWSDTSIPHCARRSSARCVPPFRLGYMAASRSLGTTAAQRSACIRGRSNWPHSRSCSSSPLPRLCSCCLATSRNRRHRDAPSPRCRPAVDYPYRLPGTRSRIGQMASQRPPYGVRSPCSVSGGMKTTSPGPR